MTFQPIESITDVVDAIKSLSTPSGRHTSVGMRCLGSHGSSSGAYQYENTRLTMVMGPQKASDIKLVYNNSVSVFTGDNTTGLSPITLMAAIEYPGAAASWRVTWGGATSITLAPGQQIVSDSAPIEIAAGATYYIRTNVSAATLGNKWATGGPMSHNYAEGDTYNNGTGANVDASLGVGPLASNQFYTPFAVGAVLGKTATPQPSILVVGDSISINGGMPGIGYDANGRHGWLEITLGQAFGNYVSLGVGSDTAANFGTFTFPTARQPVLGVGNFTHAVCEYGTNDMGVQLTLPNMQAALQSVWARLTARGMQVFQTTITPKTTSTDGWTTAANQTVTSSEAVRVAVNDWIRTTPFPLSGYFDAADQLETSRNSGIWKSPGGAALTVDGLHPGTVLCDTLLQKSIVTSAIHL